MTEVVLGALAVLDLEQITDYYLGVAGVEAASSFLDSWASALSHLKRQPASGSTRFCDVSGVTGLRVWPLRNFPHLVFCLNQQEVLLVVRILHSARDVPAHLRE